MGIKEQLLAPFKPSEIEWRVGATNSDKTKGIALPYLTNSAIQNRLDEVFGIEGWQNEFKEWKEKHQICGISCKINNEWITKWDGAQDTNMEPVKGGLSDSMKRAARMWGIGRYLTLIPNKWYKIKQQGKSYVLAETPQLPDWALPENKANVEWVEPEQINEIPAGVLKCIEAFDDLGVSQQDLENYLHNEASMFDEQNIQELKSVYLQIKKGIKQRDDFFYKEVKKPNKAKYLTETLLAEANNEN